MDNNRRLTTDDGYGGLLVIRYIYFHTREVLLPSILIVYYLVCRHRLLWICTCIDVHYYLRYYLLNWASIELKQHPSKHTCVYWDSCLSKSWFILVLSFQKSKWVVPGWPYVGIKRAAKESFFFSFALDQGDLLLGRLPHLSSIPSCLNALISYLIYANHILSWWGPVSNPHPWDCKGSALTTELPIPNNSEVALY